MNGLRQSLTIAALAGVVGATVSCGDLVRQGRAPVFLVIDSLTASRGGGTSTSGGNMLLSDVQTLVTSPSPCSTTSPCPTVFNDVGLATFHLQPKNVNGTGATSPTSNSDVTLTQYHVSFRRTDGHNVPGVDVPYAFDGAITGTIHVGGGSGSIGFELVRHTAKQESPLVQLIYSSTIISTVAEVTFYGHDQVGNEVSATGSLQVNFGDFGDQ